MKTADIEKRLAAIEHEVANLKSDRASVAKMHPIRAARSDPWRLRKRRSLSGSNAAWPQMARIAAFGISKIKGETQVIHILDTDVFTLCELSDSPEYLRLHARVLQLADDDQVVTTIITYEEQTRGWLAYAAKLRVTAHQVKSYGRLKKHLQAYLGFEVLDFDAAAAEEFDRLRTHKIRVGTSDTQDRSHRNFAACDAPLSQSGRLQKNPGPPCRRLDRAMTYAGVSTGG